MRPWRSSRGYEDQRAYWVSEPDTGQSNAINKGLARATGAVVTWLNADDYYLPVSTGSLRTIGTTTPANPDAGAFVGIGEIVDSTGHVII